MTICSALAILASFAFQLAVIEILQVPKRLMLGTFYNPGLSGKVAKTCSSAFRTLWFLAVGLFSSIAFDLSDI